MWLAQLYARMSINNIPDCDRHIQYTYVHHENRSLIQSLALMRCVLPCIRSTSSSQVAREHVILNIKQPVCIKIHVMM